MSQLFETRPIGRMDTSVEQKNFPVSIDENVSAHLIRIVMRIEFRRQRSTGKLLLDVIIERLNVPDARERSASQGKVTIERSIRIEKDTKRTVDLTFPLTNTFDRRGETDDADLNALESCQQLHMVTSR